MAENKSSISNATSVAAIAEFWDTHDLADHWDETREVTFDVALDSSVLYFAVDRALAEKLRAVAKNRGVSPETLLNVWIQENVAAKRTND